jgi:hypothetical protein
MCSLLPSIEQESHFSDEFLLPDYMELSDFLAGDIFPEELASFEKEVPLTTASFPCTSRTEVTHFAPVSPVSSCSASSSVVSDEEVPSLQLSEPGMDGAVVVARVSPTPTYVFETSEDGTHANTISPVRRYVTPSVSHSSTAPPASHRVEPSFSRKRSHSDIDSEDDKDDSPLHPTLKQKNHRR